MFKAMILFISLAIMAGCAALQVGSGSKIPVQYATLKAIDGSENITASGVLEHTQKVREMLDSDASVSLNDLLATVALEKLDPADRLLVSALFLQIENAVNDVEVAPIERLVKLHTLLGWIDDAARLAI